MKETKFIEQNREKWREFESMLQEDRRDPEKLNDLFIQITDDLSYARTFYPNRSVRMYLNSLAQRVFHNIYRGRKFPVGRLWQFWRLELPGLMWESRQAMQLALAVFVLALGIGVVSSIIDPEFARVILGGGYVDMTLENIEKGDPMAVYKQHGPLGMTVGIALNNLFVAFQTAILGVLASIGTLFMLLYNGIMVGAFQYFFIERGLFWDSFLTIWIHGTLEISAIILAGGAGLTAGSGLLFPGTYTRVQAFQITMRRGLKLFIGLIPMFLLAAFFEGFFTRFTETPWVLRLMFILASFALVLWYFVWLPWHVAKSGQLAQLSTDKTLPPSREQVVDFAAIKSSGEILSDAFTIIRRRMGLTLGAVVVSSVVFGLLAFGFSQAKVADTFFFPENTLGVLTASADFFGFEKMSFLLPLQMVLFVFMARSAYKALTAEQTPEQRIQRTPIQEFGVLMALLLPMPLFFLQLNIEPGILGWTIGILVCPMLSMWCAVMYFETGNPLRALGRTLSLMPWGLGLILGFLVVNLALLLFLFLDSQVWDIVLKFFSWLVPPGEDNMRTFVTAVTAGVASLLLYFSFLVFVLGGSLMYFSQKEVKDAAGLRSNIEKIGRSGKIRGLARE
ncbi:MAG: stage II sporulation protein M [Saprospiraceae bacterium]|nr:stage II sporulation protein M [Saprospiraceae bacterium]